MDPGFDRMIRRSCVSCSSGLKKEKDIGSVQNGMTSSSIHLHSTVFLCTKPPAPLADLPAIGHVFLNPTYVQIVSGVGGNFFFPPMVGIKSINNKSISKRKLLSFYI